MGGETIPPRVNSSSSVTGTKEQDGGVIKISVQKNINKLTCVRVLRSEGLAFRLNAILVSVFSSSDNRPAVVAGL